MMSCWNTSGAVGILVDHNRDNIWRSRCIFSTLLLSQGEKGLVIFPAISSILKAGVIEHRSEIGWHIVGFINFSFLCFHYMMQLFDLVFKFCCCAPWSIGYQTRLILSIDLKVGNKQISSHLNVTSWLWYSNFRTHSNIKI